MKEGRMTSPVTSVGIRELLKRMGVVFPWFVRVTKVYYFYKAGKLMLKAGYKYSGAQEKATHFFCKKCSNKIDDKKIDKAWQKAGDKTLNIAVMCDYPSCKEVKIITPDFRH